MWKAYGFRKPVLIVALVLVAGLMLAACSSGSSSSGNAGSTGPALQAPTGPQELASFTMTMDPGAKTITTTQPVAMSGLIQPTGGGVNLNVTTSGVVFSDPTLTGDILLKWKTGDRLEDVSIRVVGADAIGANATIDNDDAGCAGTIGASVPGCNPGISYVADSFADGPETELEILFAVQTERKSRIKRVMCPSCGQVSAPWSMTEASGNTYTFYAKVFGNNYGYDVLTDSRYDVNTSTIKIQTYQPDWPAGVRPPLDRTLPLNNPLQGQWFYASVWYDYPGASRTVGSICADGNGNTTCSITPDVWDNYDYYFVEDLDNLGNLPAYWSTSPNYNTGFLFMAGGSYRMQWDPSVLQTNDDEDATWTIGSGGNTFRTLGPAAGTKIDTYADEDLFDQMTAGVASTSNWRNIAYYSFDAAYNYGLGTPPPLPDGTDIYGDSRTPGNFIQGDANMGRIAMRANGAPGTGSRLSMSPSGNTILNTAIGLKSGDQNGMQYRVMQKSANYPTWNDATGYGEGAGGSAGHYNEQIGYVCIQ